MNRQELAIARSVVYSSLFDYPLTIDQLHRSLVECEMTPAQIASVYARSAALAEIVEHRDGFFFPAGRSDLIAERRRREARSRAFLRRHVRLLRWICLLPFTRLVALSGSLAHLNLEPDGDLDLFIITRGAHVWTVTLAVLLLTKALGRRRVVCANFILADTHLALDQQDLFTANQVIHLKPLIGAELLDAFVAANPFVARVYPNGARPRPVAIDPPSRAKRCVERLLGFASPAIEAGSRSLYGWYLRRKARSWRSPEQVHLRSDSLKLHTRSHRQSILDRFDAALQDALDRAARVAEASPARLKTAGRR
ncbi:MAG TPA: hypothetical protein VFA27_09930 [Vicinamibacterales bacterium]|nr:hypothetical protein [Vicinamibacterales bacterium]